MPVYLLAEAGFGATPAEPRFGHVRLKCANSGPLRRARREGELRTLPVIRLRRRDQQGSRHIPSGRFVSSTDAVSRKVDGFLTPFAILCARKASSESPPWL